MSVTEIVIYASYLPIVAATVYAVALYRNLPHELKVFTCFIVLSCIIQLAGLVLVLCHRHNMPLNHVYVALGFAAIAWFYRTVLAELVKPSIIWGLAAAFIVYTALNSAFIEPINTFNSMAETVESVLVVVLSLSTYIVLLNHIVKEKRKLLIGSINWINSGLFIYNASSLLINYITNYVSKTINEYIWILHAIFSMVMYCCFIIGYWKRNQQQAS